MTVLTQLAETLSGIFVSYKLFPDGGWMGGWNMANLIPADGKAGLSLAKSEMDAFSLQTVFFLFQFCSFDNEGAEV